MTEPIRSYTLHDTDGKTIRVSETLDRKIILVECPEGPVSLDYETFQTLMDLRYVIAVVAPVPFAPSRGDAVHIDPAPSKTEEVAF